VKILITGFEPFDGQSINPALEILKRFKDNYGSITILKLDVPTVFNQSIEKVCLAIDTWSPDVVLMLGQAGGRKEISIERVSINIDDANIPDNRGIKPLDRIIREDGEPAYFSSLPVKKIIEALKENNIPAGISNSAGTYVCNHLMYGVLHHIHVKHLDIKAGFIHVPFIHEQVLNKDVFSMSIDDLLRGIECALYVISEVENE